MKWLKRCVGTGAVYASAFLFSQGKVYAVDPAIFCDPDGTLINTAIGCLPTDFGGFVSMLLRFGVSMAGGIAFLLILLGGFQVLTSAGNPEQLNAGKELVGSAITGLLLIIFSVFFLKVIGVDILGIPGWD